MKSFNTLKGVNKPEVLEIKSVSPHDEEDLAKSLVKALDEFLEAENGPFVKSPSGFAPSNTNQCARFLQYRLTGFPGEKSFKGQTLRIFKLGNQIEDQVGEYFEALGILKRSQIEIDIEEPFKMHAFIDFEIEWGSEEPLLVECKSINEGGFMLRKMYNVPKDEHFRQLQMYLMAENRQRGMLLYYSKNNSEVLPLMVDRDQVFIDKLVARYQKIQKATDDGIKSKRPYKSITSKQCGWCDARNFCWTVDTEVGIKID